MPCCGQGNGKHAAERIRRGALRQVSADPRRGRLRGAMHAQIGKLMLPSCAASPRLGANAATIVAGAPTITPAAAARPMLLCIDKPDKLMTIFVMMPPPTPAKPETSPINRPEIRRQLPLGGCVRMG